MADPVTRRKSNATITALEANDAAQKFFLGDLSLVGIGGFTNSTWAVPAGVNLDITFTPMISGKYKVYGTIGVQLNGTNQRVITAIRNTVGGAALLYEANGQLSNATTQVETNVFTQSVFTLTAGVQYTFRTFTRLAAPGGAYAVTPGNVDNGGRIFAEYVGA